MGAPAPHPIVAVLAMRRMTRTSLAKTIGRRRPYVSMVLLGHLPASPDFRRRCAEALDLPERELFHPAQRDAGLKVASQ